MSSSVFGGLLGATIIKSGRDYTFLYILMALISLLASVAFWLIREPLVIVESEDAAGNPQLVAS